MKYTILINQYAAVNSGLDVDLVDLVIFDFIKDYAHSSACVKMSSNDGVFYWISHKLIIEQLPILGIKSTAGVVKRINRLVDAGLLRKHKNSDQMGRSMYAFGENYDRLLSANTDDSTHIQEDPPLYESTETPVRKYRDPLYESTGYNNNNIINNKDNIVIGAEQAPQPDERKTLFRNSKIAALVNDGDYSQFEAQFHDAVQAGIDLVAYYHAVSDWSDSSNTKRTDRGWLATVRNFIRGDIQKNCVKKVPQAQKNEYAEMLDVLNNL